MTTDLEKQAGSVVTLRGTAQDAKGGAVLVLPSGEPIYLRGVDAWPAALSGKAVQVSGLLKKEKHLPDPITKDGQLAQGAFGLQWTVENPSFQPASAP